MRFDLTARRVALLIALSVGTCACERSQPPPEPSVVVPLRAKPKARVDAGPPPEVARPAPPPPSLAGRVLDSRGQPVAFSTVVARCDAGCTATDTTTDERGAFRFAGLPDDAVVALQVRTEHGRGAWQRARVPSADVALAVPFARSVAGRVVRQSGVPVTDFKVCGQIVRSRDGRFECRVAGSVLLVHTAESDAVLTLTDEPTQKLGDVVVGDVGAAADQSPEHGHDHRHGHDDHAATPANLLPFARADLRARRVASALEYLAACRNVAPKQPECLRLQGSAFAYAGQWRDAVAAYRAALGVLRPGAPERRRLAEIAVALQSVAEREGD